MVNTNSFIKKWHGRTLQDDGAWVSKEFHSFQVSFFNIMRKIAKDMNAELVNQSYGHYDMSGFIKRGDRYVYFDYSNGIGYGGRNYVNLKENRYNTYWKPLLLRTAKHEKDYHGGVNHNVFFENCQEVIKKLLNE